MYLVIALSFFSYSLSFAAEKSVKFSTETSSQKTLSNSNNSRIKQNESYWRQQVSLSPSHALNHFNLAVVLHNKKMFAEALQSYEQVIRLRSSLSPIARYYIALIYYNQKKYDEAKASVSKIPINDIPKNLKARVLLFKNKLFADEVEYINESLAGTSSSTTTALVTTTGSSNTGSLEKQSLITGYGEFGLGQNINPLYQSEVDETSSIEADQQMQVRAGSNLNLYTGDYYESKIGYHFYVRSYEENESSNFSYHQVAATQALYFSKYRFQFTPEAIFDRYGGEAFSNSLGGTTDLTYKLGSAYLSLGLDYKTVDVQDDDFVYYNGDTRKVFFSFTQRHGDGDLRISVHHKNFDYEDDEDFSVSYNGYGSDVLYSTSSGPWRVTLAGGMELRYYDLAVNETEARQDLRLTAGTNVSYYFNKNFRLFGDASYLNNNSNFEDEDNNKDYDQLILSGGIGYSF